MDAKTFIARKHEAAVEELRAIDAEYIPKRDAAKSAIAITQKWLDELAAEKPAVVQESEISKSGVNAWISNRDLTPQARHN